MLTVQQKKSYIEEIFRINNFDIIRLMAALQVAVNHTMSHLNVEQSGSVILALSAFFPGVPIFFFVSGFLISKSYENNSVLTEYAQNRILRIYPALIVCTFIAVISVYLADYLPKTDASFTELAIWIIGQISVAQFYNPDFMRAFGTGVLNGSLWTITVELQFYILVPILYWIIDLSKPRKSNIKILCLILFFMIFHIVRYYFMPGYKDNLLFKFFSVSFLPWIYMFLVGVLFQRNFNSFHRLLSARVFYVLPVYLIISNLSIEYFGWEIGNGINPLLYFLLAVLVFSFAYSFPTLSKNTLRGNDISYGIYIYHIPVVNIVIYYGYVSNSLSAFAAITVTILIANLSWLLIEKKSIQLKRRPLNPVKDQYP